MPLPTEGPIVLEKHRRGEKLLSTRVYASELMEKPGPQRLHSFSCMKRSYYHLVLLCSILWLVAGCGKKGDPSVPIVPQPLPASEMSSRVAENGIVLAWNPPTVYDTEKALELDDIKYFKIYRKLDPPLSKGWTFNQSNEGWTTTGQSLAAKQYKGVLRAASEQKLLTILSQEELNLDAAENRFIRLKLWTHNAQQGYLTFITKDDTSWDKNIEQAFEPSVHSSYYAVHKTFNSSKLKRFPIRQTASPVAQEYLIDMQSIPLWEGAIQQIGLIVQNTSPDEELVELGLDSVEFIRDVDALASAYQSAPWIFLDDEEGWSVLPDESIFGAAHGVLYAENDRLTALFSAPGQRIDFSKTSKLQIHMKVTTGSEAYLVLRQGGEKLFRSEKEFADAASRGIRIPLKASSDFSTYTLDLTHYIDTLLNNDVEEELYREPQRPQNSQTSDSDKKGSGQTDSTRKPSYFAQLGLIFPAVGPGDRKRQILIDYIDILSDDIDPGLNASRLAQPTLPADDEIAQEIDSKFREKLSAFTLPYEAIPEEEEQISAEKILLAEISPSDPSPAESNGERFVLIDSGQFVIENDEGQEMTAALEYGNSYSYEIEVMDRKNRQSELSETTSVEFVRAPSPPRDVRAEAGDEQLTLNWSRPVLTEDGKKIRNLAAYRIFRSTRAGEYADTPLSQVSASQTHFIDSTVTNRETYYYVVQALASQTAEGSSSKRSVEVSAVPLDTSAPEAPGGLVGVYINEKVNLHWNQIPTADFAGFNLYRSDSRDGDFQKLNAELLQKASFTDDTVEAKKRYYYYVTALDDEVPPNESEASDIEPIETYPLD